MAKEKTYYIIGLVAIILLTLNNSKLQVQSAMSTFDLGNLQGWFKSLSSTTQNILLFIAGMLLLITIVTFLMRD